MFESFTSFAQSMTEMSLDSLQEEEEMNKTGKSNTKKKTDSAGEPSSSFSAIAETFGQSSSSSKPKEDTAPVGSATPAKKETVSSSKSNEDFFADFITSSTSITKPTLAATSPKSSVGTPQPVASSTPITRTPPVPSVSAINSPPPTTAGSSSPIQSPTPTTGSVVVPTPVLDAVMPVPAPTTPSPPPIADIQKQTPVSSPRSAPIESPSPVDPVESAVEAVIASGAESTSASVVAVDARCVQLQTELERKSEQFVELQTKHGSMCDKFKDTVKKLAEIKETFKNKCRHYDEEIIQYRDSLNTKEFAFMGLQERFFLLEKQASGKDLAAIQSKAKTAELEELLVQRQRECDEKDAALGRAEARSVELEDSLQQLRRSTEETESRFEELQQRHGEQTTEHMALSTELASLRQELQAKASDTTTSVHQISTLNATIAELRGQLEEGATVATQFQEYKKRAQQALKQANSSVAENSSSLQATFEASQRRLEMEVSRLTENNLVVAREREQLVVERDALQEREKLLEERAGELQRELDASSAAINALEQRLLAASVSVATAESTDSRHAPGSQWGTEGHRSDRGDSGPASATNASVLGPACGLKEPATPTAPSASFTIGGDSDGEEEETEREEEEDRSLAAAGRPPPAPTLPAASLQSPAPVHATASTVSSPGTPIVNSSQLYVVYQLQQQLQSLRADFISRGQQCDQLQRRVDEAEVEKEALQTKNGELSAFLSRIKQQLDREKDSETNKNIINFEYLKNCVYVYMNTAEKSEKRRLTPVIATILQFTDKERESVMSFVQSDKVRSKGSSSTTSDTEDAFVSLYNSMFGQN